MQIILINKEGFILAGKICVVTSVVQGNGAKYVATNLATEIMNREKNKRVLLVDFDFDNPFLAHAFVKHDEIHGIDNLANNITSEGIADDLFMENIIQTKLNVDVLKGTQFIEKPKMFSNQHIEVILDKAKKLYDYVYVVVNSKANNAGTIFSFMKADQVVLVLRNNYANLQRIDRTLKLVKQYSPKNEASVVYNFKNLNSKLNINKKFDDNMVQILGVLEYEEKGIDNLNLEKKESMFNRSINSKVFTKMNKELWLEKKEGK